MDAHIAQELNYTLGMAVNCFTRALGMHWENEKLKYDGFPPKYKEKDFDNLTLETGNYHNALCESNKRMI